MSATYSVLEAAALLGINKRTAYQMIREARFPVPVVPLGRIYRIPKAPLDELLGLAS